MGTLSPWPEATLRAVPEYTASSPLRFTPSCVASNTNPPPARARPTRQANRRPVSQRAVSHRPVNHRPVGRPSVGRPSVGRRPSGPPELPEPSAPPGMSAQSRRPGSGPPLATHPSRVSDPPVEPNRSRGRPSIKTVKEARHAARKDGVGDGGGRAPGHRGHRSGRGTRTIARRSQGQDGDLGRHRLGDLLRGHPGAGSLVLRGSAVHGGLSRYRRLHRRCRVKPCGVKLCGGRHGGVGHSGGAAQPKPPSARPPTSSPGRPPTPSRSAPTGSPGPSSTAGRSRRRARRYRSPSVT